VWRQARGWLQTKVSQLGLTPVQDAAGNHWVTLPGATNRTVIIGGHLDSVPNGGWLDGTSVCWSRWKRFADTNRARSRP
jgi:N-carbamoyl-L-amino-acid hydrolase